jgi:hypothetical protein
MLVADYDSKVMRIGPKDHVCDFCVVSNDQMQICGDAAHEHLH